MQGVAALTIMFLWFPALTPSAAEADSTILLQMQQQMQHMQIRMGELEKQNQDLKTRLDQYEQQAPVAVGTAAASPASVSSEIKNETGSKALPVEFYGFVKLDASYDTDRMNNGNFTKWVESGSYSPNDDEFNMTANQTRFGLNFKGPDVGPLKTSGKIESDFYGSGGAENTSNFRMRHAYLKMDWPESDFSILAGQTADIISPLLPNTVNFDYLRNIGNLGFRRPQVRLTKGFPIGESRVQLEGGVTRTIGDTLWGFDPGDTGEDAGFPTMQGRVSYTFPWLTEKDTTIGISGHWGEEEADYDRKNHAVHVDTWSLNLDLTLPLMEKLALVGEAWTGSNLDGLYGGAGQGVQGLDRDGNLANGYEFPGSGIDAQGGWAAFEIGPFGAFRYMLGASIDDPENGDLNPKQRSCNLSYFGNVYYNITKSLSTALEVSYWETDYIDLLDGDSLRLQGAFIYKF
jgi:hypothetical protein